MACAPGRGMSPFRPLRTLSGGPDAYQRCSARPDPRRRCGAPPIRTATAARPRPVRRRVGARFCVATLEKRGILPLSTHHPPLTPLSRPTLLTGQGLAQAEKPKPACSGSTQQQSLHRQEDGGSTSIRSSCALARCLARTNCAPRASGWLSSTKRQARASSATLSRRAWPPAPAVGRGSRTRVREAMIMRAAGTSTAGMRS
jgi:hypothetical protein